MELEPLNGNGKPNNRYATFEHLTRRRDGGAGMPNNVVLAHASCNRRRERIPDEQTAPWGCVPA